MPRKVRDTISYSQFQDRLTKQKQARDDADKEIQKIRATSEQKFTQYKNEVCMILCK
jgi:hypothetical protein